VTPVLLVPLPTDVLPTAAVPLIPVMHACVPLHRRDVAILLPVESSRKGQKYGGVPLSPHGTLALPGKSPLSPYPLLVRTVKAERQEADSRFTSLLRLV